MSDLAYVSSCHTKVFWDVGALSWILRGRSNRSLVVGLVVSSMGALTSTSNEIIHCLVVAHRRVGGWDASV